VFFHIVDVGVFHCSTDLSGFLDIVNLNDFVELGAFNQYDKHYHLSRIPSVI